MRDGALRRLAGAVRAVRREIWPGDPFPLGAHWDGGGTNFSLFSENATARRAVPVRRGRHEERIELRERTAFNWHGYLRSSARASATASACTARTSPGEGHRFNPCKLLLDPYAKSIEGPIRFDARQRPALRPDRASEDADLEPDDEDDADAIPKCVVIDPRFDWEGDRPLRTPWNQTVIYETHVKGFTKRRPGVREDLRGTYAGLADQDAIAHLKALGVTAVELLPVHHIADEDFLHPKGLTNYWGYSSIGFFAPHSAYAATGDRGQEVREFKGMVKALHRAGIEVILDVVYNHTAEGNHLGPMLCFKGVDNKSYYRLSPDDQRFYMDFTGTGNSLNVVHPSVLRLIMDSLRYWVIECHVDGFRFDLASRARPRALRRRPAVGVLRRHPPGPDPLPGQADRRAVGRRPGRLPGRQLPRPVVGVERHLPRHDARLLARRRPTAASSPAASPAPATSTRTTAGARSPRSTSSPRTTASRCTTSSPTTSKHNEANQEDNRDGTDDNRSWNHGVEGETDDPEVNALRERQQRNFLATLLLSQGAPMLLGGDEIARTQGGNNNGWCQDNEISWFDWELDERERAPARLHQAADRAAARASGLPPARLPHRRGPRRLRAARRVVVPASTGGA